KEDGIFISQDKYVADILKKFDFTTIKAANTPIKTNKALNMDEEAEDVDMCYGSKIKCLIIDETVYKEWEDIMERAATTASSLEAEQDSGNINRTHPWYALTESPTIYVSHIEQFWKTAFASTLENRDMEITATIDGKVNVVYEASIRIHLKLEDSDGISTLPTLEIFEQLALMGEHTPLFPSMLALQAEEGEGSGNSSKPQPPPFTAQPTHEEPIPNIESSSPQKTQSPRQALNKDTELPQTSVPIPNAPRDHGGASVQTKFERASKLFYDSPLRGGNTPRSDEDSMTLQELMALCTKLSDRVLALKTNLRHTKKVYGTAYTKLIMKVKKLGHTVKSSKAKRKVRLVVSEDEDELEDPSKQGRKIAQIDEDEGITLVQMSAQTQGRHEHDFEEPNFEEDYTAEPDISTANVPISTAGAEVSTANPEVKTTAESLVYIRRSAAKRKDKGKAILKEAEAEPVQKKTKLQLEQERLGIEEALRLQEQLDEEERQRIARVHEEAST
ncbi:hypothetical protein Tco_1412545, partial [Tanacetum coccineum]